MQFSFATAGQIVFGPGLARELPARALPVTGPRVLWVTGATPARHAGLAAAMAAAGASLTPLTVAGEPHLPGLLAALDQARGAGVSGVIAIGGGSVLDMGKALAGLIPAPGDPLDHLEVVGRGLPLTAAPLPMVALPTTAGTGAEVTRNAVIAVPEHRRKVSLRDLRLLPRLALIDPDLAADAPWAVTLGAGLDAVTQCVEPFVSPFATPLTDALTRDAIPRGLAALMLLQRGEDAAARSEMAWVSLCGGLALANARLGAVHGLAGVIGGWTGAAHGALCGRLLAPVLAANRAHAGAEAQARLDAVAGWIGDALGVPAAGGFDALADWCDRAGLPRLAAMGLDPADHAAVATAAGISSSMQGNPVVLPDAVLRAVLEAA